VRFNRGGELRVPFGYVAGLHCDPVEKKPFFHVLPGSAALTFGMLGCNLHCAYCQNWVSSQALRDPDASAGIQLARPEQLVDQACRCGARLVVSSYNEPLITAEWAEAIFRVAIPAGLVGACVSNGMASPEVLRFLRPWVRALKIDLKTFNDHQYRRLGGTLDHVTRTLRLASAMGFWLEVVTLLVPGFNDSETELRQIAEFLVSLNPDIPWHVTAFHPDYQMTSYRPARAEDLLKAINVGVRAGLRYVYAGNLPGRVAEWENTRCPNCQETLVQRTGFLVSRNLLESAGRCVRCQHPIAGVWS
jgi:pyruvate formate lyase activating enzyme